MGYPWGCGGKTFMAAEAQLLSPFSLPAHQGHWSGSVVCPPSWSLDMEILSQICTFINKTAVDVFVCTSLSFG